MSSKHFINYKRGDKVRFVYGGAVPGDFLTGTVKAVEDYGVDPWQNQKLTIEWTTTRDAYVGVTHEYAQDVELLPNEED